MTKNEIVAGFMNLYKEKVHGELLYSRKDWSYEAHNLEYNSSYDWLHEAWVKFRDLRNNNSLSPQQKTTLEIKCSLIGMTILYNTITEAFDELVKGIEWYNSLNK